MAKRIIALIIVVVLVLGIVAVPLLSYMMY